MNVIKVKNKDYLDKYDINLIRKRLLFWPLGGVVTQRPAKPWTPVRIWQWPPFKIIHLFFNICNKFLNLFGIMILYVYIECKR